MDRRSWFVARLERAAGHGPITSPMIDAGDSFASGGHAFYRVDVPTRRRLAREWLKEINPSAVEVVATADALITGPTHEEKSLGPMLLQYHAAARRSVKPEQVEGWLLHLVGWAEVDGLCQSAFKADDLVAHWGPWKAMILRLTTSNNVSQRRGALVLLTGPVRANPDDRLARLAFTVLDRSIDDRDQLITKAVSWLLRSMTTHHADAVADYLSTRGDRVPAIAVRETNTKLRTGRKSG